MCFNASCVSVVGDSGFLCFCILAEFAGESKRVSRQRQKRQTVCVVREVTDVTNMELAYRLAEIEKVYADTPRGMLSNYAFGLQKALVRDLVNDGVGADVAYRIAGLWW